MTAVYAQNPPGAYQTRGGRVGYQQVPRGGASYQPQGAIPGRGYQQQAGGRSALGGVYQANTPGVGPYSLGQQNQANFQIAPSQNSDAFSAEPLQRGAFDLDMNAIRGVNTATNNLIGARQYWNQPLPQVQNRAGPGRAALLGQATPGVSSGPTAYSQSRSYGNIPVSPDTFTRFQSQKSEYPADLPGRAGAFQSIPVAFQGQRSQIQQRPLTGFVPQGFPDQSAAFQAQGLAPGLAYTTGAQQGPGPANYAARGPAIGGQVPRY